MPRAIAKQIALSDVSRQGGITGFTARLREALGDRTPAWLAKETGLPDASIRKYLAGSAPTIIPALVIADKLKVSLDWLIAGSGPKDTTAIVTDVPGAKLFDAASAEWVFVPRYRFDLVMTAVSSVVIETYPMRRDWLYRSLGTVEHIWITEMPTDDMPSVAAQGDTIICRNALDIREGLAYVFSLDGQLVVRRAVVDPKLGLALRTDDPAKPAVPLSHQLLNLIMIGRVLAKISLSPVPVSVY